VSISIPAFLFFLGFAVSLGYFFAWVYNYRKLHGEPNAAPQRITDTISIPSEITIQQKRGSAALKRMEQEKTCYETDTANKEAFIKKLLALFRSRLEKKKSSILSICYWAFNGEGFILKLSNSSCRISENLFVPKSNRYFAKKDFNWNGMDESPIDVFHSEEQITCSMAGSVVSGDGKLRGYITIDSSVPNAFDDEMCMELRELAALTEEVLRILDMNLKQDNENNLFYGMLKDISDLFSSVSKSNLIINLSKILQDNFRFDRLMLITPEKYQENKWYIFEALGEQREEFKGVSFSAHEKCLLSELLARRVSLVNRTRLSTDPYQRRLYENEPENLELRSLFAVTAPMQNNSYPLIIMLESRNNRAVSRIDETMLNSIVSCAALKLSEIQAKDDSWQKKEKNLIGIDSNGLGELLNYYETEINHLRNDDDSLGILFIKCLPAKKENMAECFEKFSEVLKSFKKAWNVRHLSMLGNGEFVLSMKGVFDEALFNAMTNPIITSVENELAENSVYIKRFSMWLNRNKIKEREEKYGQNAHILFSIQVMKEFKAMSGMGE
jgi:hypothetical protein